MRWSRPLSAALKLERKDQISGLGGNVFSEEHGINELVRWGKEMCFGSWYICPLPLALLVTVYATGKVTAFHQLQHGDEPTQAMEPMSG